MPHAGEGRVSRNRVSLEQSKGTGTGICKSSLVGVLVSFRDHPYFRHREVVWEYQFGIAGALASGYSRLPRRHTDIPSPCHTMRCAHPSGSPVVLGPLSASPKGGSVSDRP